MSYKTTTNLQGINVLDYELAVPITISFKKVEICLNPIFIMPVNPIKTITTIENKKTKLIESIIISTPISERNLESFLYWGLSFTYKIN